MNPGREVLQKLYCEQGLSLAEVGKIIGVSNVSVMLYLRREGVPLRSKSEAKKLAQVKYPNSEKQREAARRQAAKARAGLTEESFRKMVATRRKKGVNYSRGENNHMWRGGGPVYRSPDYQWKIARFACYDRDGWLCQDCGCECLRAREANRVDPTRCIQAHHVVPRRHGGLDDLENLVTLCLSCHRKREAAYADALFA